MNRSVFHCVAAAALLSLTLLACSDSGDQEAQPQPADTTAQPQPADTTSADTLPPLPQDLLVDLQRMDQVNLPNISPGARYLVALCALDLAPAAAASDPGAALLALLDTVPTDDPSQEQELAAIRAGFAAGLASDDPVRSPQLFEATNLLRLRCG